MVVLLALDAGESILPPLALTPRKVIRSTVPGEMKIGSGQRCWRKQSLMRHCIVRSAPCETRYAGQVANARCAGSGFSKFGRSCSRMRWPSTPWQVEQAKSYGPARM
jgi:hypothetical protein